VGGRVAVFGEEGGAQEGVLAEEGGTGLAEFVVVLAFSREIAQTGLEGLDVDGEFVPDVLGVCGLSLSKSKPTAEFEAFLRAVDPFSLFFAQCILQGVVLMHQRLDFFVFRLRLTVVHYLELTQVQRFPQFLHLFLLVLLVLLHVSTDLLQFHR
jgi:hypothetical protein